VIAWRIAVAFIQTKSRLLSVEQAAFGFGRFVVGRRGN